MNIENMLESISEGLRKIGCKAEKRKLIMQVLTDSHILSDCKTKLVMIQSAEEYFGSDELEAQQIETEKQETTRVEELKAGGTLTADHLDSFLVFDVSEPIKDKGGEK